MALNDDTMVTGKATLGIAAGALVAGVAIGLFINRRGRDLNLKVHPKGFWSFIFPAVDLSCHDTKDDS